MNSNPRHKKIVLIQPPFTINKELDYIRTSPNLVASTLSAVLHKELDVDITYVDAFAEGNQIREEMDEHYVRVGMTDAQIKERIQVLNPSIVGILNHFTCQYPAAIELAKKIKAWDDSIVTLIGGAHPTGDYENILKEHCIDYIFVGEAEKSLVNLILHLEGRKQITNLDGIASQHFLGNRLIGRTNYHSLTDLPDPDFKVYNASLYPPELYHTGSLHGKCAIDYVFTRGCPYQCEYCCAKMKYGDRVRRYPIDRIRHHFDTIRDLGYDEIMLMDDNILVDYKFAQQIFEYLHKKDFYWNIIGGMDRSLCNEMIAREIIGNKCSRVHFSFETQNEWIISRYQKKRRFMNFQDTCEFVDRFASRGVEVFVDFMIGFPEETKQDIWKTVEAARELKNHGMGFALFHCVTPFPGTSFHSRCLEQGLITERDYRKYSFSQGVLSTLNFTASELTELRQEAMIEVNGEELFRHTRKIMNRPDLRKYYGEKKVDPCRVLLHKQN